MASSKKTAVKKTAKRAAAAAQASVDAKGGYIAPPPPKPGEFGKARIALIVTRWNVDIVDRLLDGARACLKDWGVADKNIELIRAPGAYEVPLACRIVLDGPRFDGAVALGAVIRGDTPHFDYVAGECSRGLIDVQLATGKPLGFGVLTVNTVQQAVDRAGPGSANKGYEAAAAMLEMLRLRKEWL